ncbi:MAG: hypothetical protein II994_08770, partial [Lachnospiraceae bacterium]|nr:hypothetical protein [Lachnospiraceae bacterium]
MRKIRVLATIIIFCLMLGQIPDAFLQTVYAQNSTLLNVGGFKIYNSENNVMGGEVTSGQEMKQGQAIIITFDWDVNNAATTGSFTGTINLQEMAENIKVGTVTSQPLVDANGNPVDGATFSINQNGELTININDLSQASNRLGKAKINAVVNVGNSDDEREALSGEEVNIKIDDASATVVFTNNGEESYFDVSKEAVGKASKVGTDLIQPFKIKLKARNNKVYFEDNDYIADVVSANTELSLVENSLVVTSNNNSLAGTYQNFETLTAKLKEIGTIDGATTIEIAYDMKVSNNAVDIYSQEYESNKDAFKNTVDVKYHDNKGNQEQNSWTSAYADVNRASVAKSGTYNAEQESVEWTISIHLGDIDDGTKTLSEMVTSLKDIPANGQFDLTGNNNFNAGQWDMTSLLNSFTKNGEGVYTYTFSLPVSDSVKETTSQTDLLNNVEMEVNGHTYSTQGKVTFGGRNWLGKNAGTYDAENKQIYWDVTLTDIPEGVSEVTLTDEIPTWDLAAGNDNHTLGNSDIVLMAENSSPVSLVTYTGNNATLNSELVASYEVDASGKQMVLKLKDAFVTNYKQRDVIIRYATTVGDSVVAERIYRNGIKLDYKENGVSATQRRADSSIRMTNPIKKECEYSNANNFTANYKLSADLTAIPELLALDLGTFNWGVIESANETVIITDTLPLNMKLKEISSIYTDGDWGAYQDNYTPYYSYTTQTVTKADGEHQQVVLTFTLTKQLIKDMQDKATAGKSLNLVVNYVTEVDDKAAFTEAGVEQEFVNTAEFSYDNISRGSIDESIKMTPIDAVKKEYSYTPEEAPYVYYTITVNPGAVDFVENSDWLQAVDTLSSGLKYHDFKDTSLDGKRALKVEKKVGNNWVTLTPGSSLAANDGDYAYEIGKDAAGNDQCTFRLPDATSLRITYVARMILPQGTVLTAVNSSNTFELTATSGDKTTDKIDMTASGTSYGSSVSVESDTGSITIYKYYEDANGTNQPVPNTTFQIKLCEWDATNKVLKEKEIFTADTTNVVGSEHLITVGANGKITVNRLLLDNIYALYEITPGSQDVVKEDKPYYFILQGNESLEFPDEFTETRKVLFAKGAQAPQLDFENQLKPVPEKGKLILTKELKGDITAEEAENIDFTVTCENTGSTYSETFNVKDDFTYANGVYTLEIGDLAPGTYTVQEV